MKGNFSLKFDFFSDKTPPLLGVDISSAFVKVVELSSAGQGAYKLEGYAIVPIAKDAVVEGNISALEQVAESIRLALRQLNSREKRAALALPSSAVITKKVFMQADLREDEMEAQVEGEANQYIPFSLDEVNLDFQVIGPGKDEEDVEVLIAASRKEKIEDRVAVAEEAGLKVTVMDVETYATEAAYHLVSDVLPNGGAEQVVMVVDIGATIMHINVLNDNESIYTREQNFGGEVLTQEIQRRFGLSAEEAEIAKRKGGLPESYEEEVLEPFVANLAGEVARAMQFFTGSTEFSTVDHIILAGGCSAIKGVDLAVQERTQLNVVVANPFHKMALGNRVKKDQLIEDAPALMTACGLALRGVD